MKLPRFKRSIKQSVARLDVRQVLPLTAIALFIIWAIVSQHVPQSTATGNEAELAAYSEALKGQVDSPEGAPSEGRDPANQQQTTLEAAASQSTGIEPYAKIDESADEDHSHHHGTAPSDPEAAGVGANGCYIDYGKPGEQCVPAHVATDGVLLCKGDGGGVNSLYPNGVLVTGTDRYDLDTNNDKTACGSGDTAA